MGRDNIITIIIILSIGLLASIQNSITSNKDYEMEIAGLRENIKSFSVQKKAAEEFVYKYTSPIELEDLIKKTSPFGYRELLNPYTGGTRASDHMGLDLVGRWRSRIYPIDPNGEVIDVWLPPDGYYKGHPDFGGYVRIEHLDKWITGYPHLSSIYVREGDKLIDGLFYRNGKLISSKNVLGRQGNTGTSTGDHLHISIQKPDGDFVDPLRYIELREE